jgi:hypothetical protein
VLNLSGINNAGAVAWSRIDCLDDESGKDLENIKVWARYQFQFQMVCAHLSPMAGLGIWLSSKVTIFGGQPHCAPETLTILFGHDIPATNKTMSPQWLCTPSSHFRGIGINLVLLITLLTLMFIFVFVLLSLTVLLKKTFRPRSFARRLAFIGAPLLGALLVLLFVVDAELMIRSNKGLVKEGQSQWTFGQTLAMLMVVLPLVEVTKQGFGWYRGDHEEKEASSDNLEIKLSGGILDALEPSPLNV